MTVDQLASIDELFDEMVRTQSLIEEESILERAKIYLEKKFPDESANMDQLFFKNEYLELITSYAEQKEYPKKLILSCLEYLIDPHDIIPDYEDGGFEDDEYILLKTKKEIFKIQQLLKRGSTLKYPPKDIEAEIIILSDHILDRTKSSNIFDNHERLLIKKLFHYYRANKPITRKELLTFTVILTKYLNSEIPQQKCSNLTCGDCELIRKFIERFD